MDLNNLKKVLFLIFSILTIINCNAQELNTNLTNDLMAIHLNTSTSPYLFKESNKPETTRIKLSQNNADCFLATFKIPPQSTLPDDIDLLSFQLESNGIFLNATPFMKIGMSQGKNGWYVDRYYVDKNGSYKNIRYMIYDDIGYGGKYTLIISNNWMGIAHDVANNKWDFAPLFFGLSSNLGHDGGTNYKDAFLKSTGPENSNPQIVGSGPLENSNISVFLYKSLKKDSIIYTSKILDLINELDTKQNNISNAKEIITHTKPLLVTKKEIKNETIIIYPNPAFNEITVITPLKEKTPLLLEIMDINGKVVYEEKYLQPAANKFIVLPNNLKTGIYIVTIESEQSHGKVKLIINK